MAGEEMERFELPEECWELVFGNLTQPSHWQAVSLTCMQFLYISNRLRPSFTVGNVCSTSLKGGLPRLLQRFVGLQSIDLSQFQGNLARPILTIAHADLPDLRAISLQGQKGLPTEAIEELGRHHRGLLSLNCSRFQVWQDSDLFTVARSFPLLEELDISYPQHGFRLPPAFFPDPSLFPGLLTDAGIEIMASILIRLRSFNTSGHFMLSDYSLQTLALRCRELTELTVFDCPFVSDEGLKFFSSHCPNLETLAVNGGRVTSLGIENVISTSHNLHSLNLSHTVVTDGLVRDLAHCHVDLKKLVLAGCKGMSSAGLLTLAQGCPHMVHLDLEGAYYLMDEHMIVLAESFPDLAFLRVNYCSMLTDVSFYSVLHNCKKLQELHMEGTGLGWGITEGNTFPVQPRSHLTKLKLAWNKPIRDSALGSIAKLCPSLLSLDLSYCLLITHLGLTAIGKGCPNLRELSLKGCKKVQTLGTLAGYFNRLEYLELESSSFTDAGLVSVSRSCRNLTFLGLHGCVKVTDAGLRVVMEECRELKQLNLKDCHGISNEELVWMVFCRPTLRKLVLPSFTISKGQKSRLTRHGCELVTHKSNC